MRQSVYASTNCLEVAQQWPALDKQHSASKLAREPPLRIELRIQRYKGRTRAFTGGKCHTLYGRGLEVYSPLCRRRELNPVSQFGRLMCEAVDTSPTESWAGTRNRRVQRWTSMSHLTLIRVCPADRRQCSRSEDDAEDFLLIGTLSSFQMKPNEPAILGSRHSRSHRRGARYRSLKSGFGIRSPSHGRPYGVLLVV